MKTRVGRLAFWFLASLLFTVHSSATTYYVAANSPNPVLPYTSWATAATNIEDAAGVAAPGDTVLVTNGVYGFGGAVVYGQETNRVALTNGITLLSVNGPNTTAIVGGTQTRCVYVGSNSVVSGFTITNGAARNTGDITNEQSGGGVWCQAGGVVSNCLISGNASGANYGRGGGIYGGTVWNSTLYRNSSGYGAGAASASFFNCLVVSNALMGGNYGGGVYQGTLSNCTIAANWAYNGGGGAYQSTLYNCTVTGNNGAWDGGGTYQGTNINCLIKGNTSSGGGGGTYAGTHFNCSITGNTAQYGGGAYQSTNYDCFITGNTASTGGGGAYGGWLCNCVLNGNTATNYSSSSGGGLDTGWIINCTVTGNTASGSGGGMSGGDAFNSIIYFNSAPSGPNWTNGADFGYCCTTPWVGWPDCITNDPAFVDAAGSDFRLKSGSACIDAGISSFSPLLAPTNDIRGVSRPVAGNPGIDMGAYEYDPAIDQTRPLLQLVSFPASSTNGFQFQFSGQSNAVYPVQVATNLVLPVVWQNLQTITGTGGMVQVTDANATNRTGFYRVRVQ